MQIHGEQECWLSGRRAVRAMRLAGLLCQVYAGEESLASCGGAGLFVLVPVIRVSHLGHQSLASQQ